MSIRWQEYPRAIAFRQPVIFLLLFNYSNNNEIVEEIHGIIETTMIARTYIPASPLSQFIEFLWVKEGDNLLERWFSSQGKL